MATIHHPPTGLRARNQWTVNYTQGDVDTIREQIVQDEHAKRHWLVLALLVVLAALAGAIVLLSTNYAMYSSTKSENKSLADENASLKVRSDQTQQQLDARTAQEARDAEERAKAQSKLDKIMPGVLNGHTGGAELASFARTIYYLPNSRVVLDSKPPDSLFRNWKVSSGSTTETFTLVGGFVDGKWVVYSNLIARRSAAGS